MIQNNNAAGHPQPQRVRQLRQGRPALLVRRGAVRLGEERPARQLRQERHLPGQDVRHARPVLGPRAVLQQGPVRQGRHRGAAEDLGRVRGRRQEDHRARDGNVGYAMPLGPEEAQAEFSIWMFNNGGDWKTDGKWTINSPAERRDPDVPQEPGGDRQGHAEQPRQDQPHRRRLRAVPVGQGRHGGRLLAAGRRRSTRTTRSTTATAPMPTKAGGAPRRTASPTT